MKNMLTHILFGLVCVGVYAQVSKAEAPPTPPPKPPVLVMASDEQCMTWLFQSNLMQARERVCGRKNK